MSILKYAFDRIDKILFKQEFLRILESGRSISLYTVIEDEFPVARCIIENTFTRIDCMFRIILPKFMTVFN